MRAKILFLSGLAFSLLSFIQYLWPQNSLPLILFYNLLTLGLILIGEGLTSYFTGKSLVRSILSSRKSVISFILISVIGGFLIDLIAVWLGKLWVYPFFTTKLYYLLLYIPGWTLYWLMIAESYLGIKAILEHFSPKKSVNSSFPFENSLFNIIGIIGFILFPFSFFFLSKGLVESKAPLILLNDPINYKVNFILILAAFISIWFIFEFWEFKQNKTSLIKAVLCNYWIPLISIIIAALFLSTILEFENLPLQFWKYTNWPFSGIGFTTLPVSILLAWPLQYIAFLSLLKIASGPESENIWIANTKNN